jgi:hypothetical protein
MQVSVPVAVLFLLLGGLGNWQAVAAAASFTWTPTAAAGNCATVLSVSSSYAVTTQITLADSPDASVPCYGAEYAGSDGSITLDLSFEPFLNGQNSCDTGVEGTSYSTPLQPTGTTQTVTAQLPGPGDYGVCVTADGEQNDNNAIGALLVNQQSSVPPAVSAGPGQTVRGDTAVLTGTASSSAGISGTTWAQLSGPSNASFSSGSALQTHVSVTAPGTYVFQLTAVGDNGLTASADVKVVFIGSLRVTATLSDVPVRPDPGRSASELLTITVTNPDGSPAAGASVEISSAPRVILRTNADGQVTLSMPVDVTDASVTITATADGQRAAVTQELRSVTPESCTVTGYLVDIPRLTLDLMTPEAEVPAFLEGLETAMDLIGNGISAAQARTAPAAVAFTQYIISVPGASDIYATRSILSDEHGRRTATVGPYYSRSLAHPDPEICVLTTGT